MLQKTTLKRNNKFENHTNCLFFFLLTILISLFCGCNKPKISEEIEPGQWKMSFAAKLPHDKPDACLQLIEDSVRLLEDQAWMCENIMYNASESQTLTVYFQHLDNFETLANGRFTKLGEKKTKFFKGQVNLFRGFRYTESGRYDSAFFFLDKSLKLFEEIRDSAAIKDALIKTANTYAQCANYVKATDLTRTAMTYIQKDDLRGKADCLNELAYCYAKSKVFDKAKMYEFEAISVSESDRDTLKIAQLYSNLANYFVLNKQGDSALWAVQKSVDLFSRKKYTESLPYCNMNLGGAYRLLGNYPKALAYSEEALRVFDRLQQHIYAAMVTNQIANCYQDKGDWQRAKIHYAKVLTIIDSFPKPDLRSRVYDSLTVLAFQEQGDANGLRQLRENKSYNQTQFSTERQQIVENMNVRYETAQRNEKIKTLNQKNKTLQLQILLGLLGLLSALGFVGFRNRQQKAIILKENEILAAKERANQTALASNKQQLALFTNNILSKNQLISDLEVRISQLIEQETVQLKEDDDENRERLANMKILTDDDWKTYLKYFTEVHKNFMERAEKDLSDLTTSELRLFMLLKQGFNTKDMADVLGISVAGVKKSRYRLRKKLLLSEDDNLEAYVQAF